MKVFENTNIASLIEVENSSTNKKLNLEVKYKNIARTKNI